MKAILAIVLVIGLAVFAAGCLGGGKVETGTGGGAGTGTGGGTAATGDVVTDADIGDIGSGIDDVGALADDAVTDDGVDVSAIDDQTF